MSRADSHLTLVQRIVAVYLEDAERDEAAVAAVLEAEGVPATHALFAATIVPSAFGRVLVKELGVAIANDFQVKDAAGEWVAFVFGDHPIASAALRLAVATRVHGPAATFEALATRSAEVSVVNNALARGLDVSNAKLKGCQVFGVTPEDVEAAWSFPA